MAKHCVFFQHDETAEAGTFESLLISLGWQVTICPPGATVEERTQASRDADLLVILGGGMGVCDAAPARWMEAELRIIRERINSGRPVLGLCLGGQMIAAAMGGRVSRAPTKELGWWPVRVQPGAPAWFKEVSHSPVVFQWHGDAFEPPRGATPLASSPACPHQAFTMADGRVLALQFHAEFDPARLDHWIATDRKRELEETGPCIMNESTLRRATAEFGPGAVEAARRLVVGWLHQVGDIATAPPCAPGSLGGRRSVLVTGGAGFIGSNLLRHLVPRYPETRFVNLDVLTYAANMENLKPVEGASNYCFVRADICDRAGVEAVFAEHAIDGVMHLAAESHVDRSILGPEAFVRTNVLGTHTLLDVARKAWAGRDGRFLHVSTDEVYGSLGPTGLFTEETPYDPSSPYSASKAGSDHLARAYARTFGMDVVTTNCSNNYGPLQFPEKLIPLMIMNASQGKPLPVYGDGRNVRDWLFVGDHAEALDLVFRSGTSGRTYNIGGHNEWPNIEIVQLVCDLVDALQGTGPEGPRRRLITFVKDRPGHDRRYAIDAGRIARELGWTPRRTFEQGIRETVRWYLDNKEWLSRCVDGTYREYYRLNYGAAV